MIDLDPKDRPGYEAWLKTHHEAHELIFDIDTGLAIKAVYVCPQSTKIVETKNIWRAIAKRMREVTD